MCLEDERIGALHIVTHKDGEVEALKSQLRLMICHSYGAPPAHGARVAAEILGDSQLRQRWLDELQGLAGRLGQLREELADELERAGVPGDFAYLRQGRGLYAVLKGCTMDVQQRLRGEYHIHVLENGRYVIEILVAVLVYAS